MSPIKISNSQIASFQKCKRRFYYEHILKLRPEELPVPMERGLAGHDMLEAFFLSYMIHGDYDKAMEAVQEVLLRVIAEGKGHEIIYRHVAAFGAYVDQQKFEVIEVEVNSLHSVSEEEDLEFAYTPDVILAWTSGARKGLKFMLDFKFTGQYWTDKEVAVYQQVPKYIAYWNKMHPEETTPLRYGGVAMLNTRAAASATGANLFMIKWLEVNKTKLANIVLENEIIMREVKAAREGLIPFTRSVDTYGCKMCIFAEDLCPMELNGHDVTNTIKANYVVNTYFDDNYGDKEKANDSESPVVQ